MHTKTTVHKFTDMLDYLHGLSYAELQDYCGSDSVDPLIYQLWKRVNKVVAPIS